MLARLKCRDKDNTQKIINGVNVPVKPNIGDYLFLEELNGLLKVTRVTITCRLK